MTGRQRSETAAGDPAADAEEPDGPSGGAEARPVAGRLLTLRRRPWLTLSAAAAVVAAAVAVPVATGEEEPGCWQVPAPVRALTGAPDAATEALDPGRGLARLDAATTMLAHEHVCGDGARTLGRVVNAATGASGPGEPHTRAQARSAYAVAAALNDVELPEGLAPGVARMLAEYVVDTARNARHGGEAAGPAVPASAAVLDDQGYTWLGRFLAPGEAYAGFGYGALSGDAAPDIRGLRAELAKNPEAFAILYDAERAYFAYYLERLTRDGGDPDHKPSDGRWATTPTTWPDHDLKDVGNRVGELMKHRARYARDGTIPDLAAWDAAVREHTAGTFRPAERRLTTREPMGRIAERPVSGGVQGPLMDGRYQLFKVLDRWTDQRDVPPPRAAAMRQLVDDGYVLGLWLIS
jgi:hypothetical protein